MYFSKSQSLQILLFLTCLAIIGVLVCQLFNPDKKPPVLEPVFRNNPFSQQFIKKAARVKRGDTLLKLLSQVNASRRDMEQITTCFNTVYDVRRIVPEKPFQLLYDVSMNLQGFEYQPQRDTIIRVVRNMNGEFEAQKLMLPHKRVIERTEGRVNTSLYQALLQAGEKPELIIAFSDIFQWDIDFFTDPRPGDRFRLLFSKKMLAGRNNTFIFSEYGRILAAQYIQQDTTFTAIYFNNAPAQSGYYDKNGKALQKAFLKSPLNYRRISSHFSHARRHPILKIVRPHYAVDFAAAAGTPVSAAGDGVVVAMGYNKGLGNYIKIRHTNRRYVTRYGHLKAFASTLFAGKSVKQGEVIGYVGQTGLATGPHLDYAFYDNDRPIDPLKINIASGDPVLQQNRQAFKLTKAMMLNLLNPPPIQSRSSVVRIAGSLYRLH